jgi:catechol 2,3-dioxygenase-like lactoylglutathione lyase family enzyme
MIRTGGLHHIHILVRSMNRSLRFYQSVFGLEELFREDELVFLRTPGSTDLITLHEAESDEAGSGGGVRHFGFLLTDGADLDLAVNEVQESGGRLIRRGEHEPGLSFAYVADPDGYVIELDARSHLQA